MYTFLALRTIRDRLLTHASPLCSRLNPNFVNIPALCSPVLPLNHSASSNKSVPSASIRCYSDSSTYSSTNHSRYTCSFSLSYLFCLILIAILCRRSPDMSNKLIRRSTIMYIQFIMKALVNSKFNLRRRDISNQGSSYSEDDDINSVEQPRHATSRGLEVCM